MKKKWIAIIAFAVLILAVVLSLTFCGRDEAPEEPVVEATEEPTVATEATEAPTTEPPAPTEPEWEPGRSLASYAEAFYTVFDKNAEVEVVGQFLDYYVIAGEQYDLIVEKRFVRLSTDDPFESWTGYTNATTNVFDSVYMREEPVAQLTANTKVTVLEGKGNWLYIAWEGGEGYVKPYAIDKNSASSSNGGNTNSGGNNTGNAPSVPVDGTDVDVSLLTARDSQVQLVKLGAYYGPEVENNFEKGTGVILADNVEAYLTLYQYGDEIKVLEYDEEYCTVYLKAGITAKLPRYLVALEGDDTEAPWTGYAESGAVVYKEYQRRNEWGTLERNTTVEVLDKLPGLEYGDDGVYVVSINGEILYMNVHSVSEDKIVPPTSSGVDNNDGGSGGGNNDGGSGDSGSSGNTESVWTPPRL